MLSVQSKAILFTFAATLLGIIVFVLIFFLRPDRSVSTPAFLIGQSVKPIPNFQYEAFTQSLATGLQGFGSNMFINKDGTFLVGVNGTFQTNNGALDTFQVSSSFQPGARFQGTFFAGNKFGETGAMSPDGKWLAIGAIGASAEAGQPIPRFQGRVAVLGTGGSTLSLIQELNNPSGIDATVNVEFGTSIGFSSDSQLMLITANANTTLTSTNLPIVWIYSQVNGNAWVLRDFLKSPTGSGNPELFGNITFGPNSSQFLITAANSGDDAINALRPYQFVNTRFENSAAQQLLNMPSNVPLFNATAISGDGTVFAQTAIVGGVNTVYIATFQQERWVLVTTPIMGSTATFGTSLAFTDSGAYLVISDPGITGTFDSVGEVYVYRRLTLDSYGDRQTISYPESVLPANANVCFGDSLKVTGSENGTIKLFIGAPGAVNGEGAIFLYTFTVSS